MTDSKKVLAWHFTDGRKLRDGTPLRVGTVYRVEPPIVLCEHGLHASERLIDALWYALGSTLSRVELSGEIVRDHDKLAATERKVLWTIDATRPLRRFAVWCAYGTLLAERAAGREPHPDSWAVVAVAHRVTHGKATRDELAHAVTHVTAYSAARAAYTAAFSAAAAVSGAARAAAVRAARAAVTLDAARAATTYTAAVAAQDRALTRFILAERRRAR